MMASLTVSSHSAATSLIAILLVSALLLSGCAGVVTEEVWVSQGEQWKVEITLSLTQAEREMFGEELERIFEQATAEAEEDIAVDWSEREQPDGGVTYTFTIQGSGLESLNEAAFDGEATLTKDEVGHIHLAWVPMISRSLRDYTLTIHGGRILSSNADEETASSATWHNPMGRIEVEFTESGWPIAEVVGIGLACACLLGLVAGGAGVTALLLMHGKRQPETL